MTGTGLKLPPDAELRKLMDAVASGSISPRLGVAALHMMIEHSAGFDYVLSLRGSTEA